MAKRKVKKSDSKVVNIKDVVSENEDGSLIFKVENLNLEPTRKEGIPETHTIVSPTPDAFINQILDKEELTRYDIAFLITEYLKMNLKEFCSETTLNFNHWKDILTCRKQLGKHDQEDFKKVFRLDDNAKIIKFKKD